MDNITMASAVASARAALDLIKLGIAARDDAKVQAALIDANMRLLELSTAALALSEKNNALQANLTAVQREKSQIESKVNDRAAYVLHEVRPGAFVYAPKDASSSGQQTYYLCQPCYDKGVKTILRSMESMYGSKLLECAENKQHEISQFPEAPPR